MQGQGGRLQSSLQDSGRDNGNAEAVAAAFRQARLSASPLAAFPGIFPTSIAEAYAIQDQAISGFPDRVRGWKVAGIHPDLREKLGANRLAGPVFSTGVRQGDSGVASFPVFSGGFAAVEAEFILVAGRDIPPGETLDAEALLAAVHSMHAGVETAGSPFAAINDMGPLAVISDFGNNSGIIVGAEIAGWQDMPLESITSRTIVNGVVVGEGSAAKVMDGPLAAFEFLVGNLGRRGITLRAGDYVSTGMTTGIHAVEAGDRVVFEFVGGRRIVAEAILATPA